MDLFSAKEVDRVDVLRAGSTPEIFCMLQNISCYKDIVQLINLEALGIYKIDFRKKYRKEILKRKKG